MSLLDELSDAATATPTDLENIVALAKLQVELESKVDAAQEELKMLQSKLRTISQGELPAAMKAAGLTSFQLEDGRTILFGEEWTISVPKKRKGEIIAKLRDLGYDSMVSNSMSIDIGLGKDNVAGEIAERAAELGLEVVRFEDVNSASLKKLLKTRREKGENDDLSFYGAFVVQQSKVK